MSGSGKKSGAGPLKNAVLIAGPTASGKSALALETARRTGGAIINADSMQVYSVLRLLTARPGDDDLAAADHYLYGHVHPSVAYSAGAWLRDVTALTGSGACDGRPAIFVGGTGLYFRALLGGLAEMPQIDPSIRKYWRKRLKEEGPQQLHGLLREQDRETAERLGPADGPRIVRALEVLESTGRSIRDWRAGSTAPLVHVESAGLIVIEPDRVWLEARIRRRFEAMLLHGALEEVSALIDLHLDPALPAMKAIGVAELREVIAGRMKPGEAIDRAVIATRQYAKRQSTWFRNQMGAEWRRVADVEEGAAVLFGDRR